MTLKRLLRKEAQLLELGRHYLESENEKPTITFIGGGNMARNIIIGLVNSEYDPNQIWVTNRGTEKLNFFREKLGVHTTQENREGVSHAADARHGERSEGAYSAVGSDFLPSVSDCKKSLRAVKSFESPCVVEP
ncbi:pyrroline-5-carboxylate reductase family protein [Candidiatus Paracoxiella cheracis]|uniref:pyrroline-5-carboxylate reductase family protein n=1 Tax=Candidiatus Paracoxiella cheracis TaxID=3405120 RepID=UPI003BF603D2